MKHLNLILKALQIIGICIVLYVGYTAIVDFKNFIKNPFEALKEAFPISSTTKINVKVLEDELLKKIRIYFCGKQFEDVVPFLSQGWLGKC